MLEVCDTNDPCCGKPLGRAIQRAETAELTSWDCPKCGSTWKPEIVGGCIRAWVPEPEGVTVLRVRG
jgi:hypothetical protein